MYVMAENAASTVSKKIKTKTKQAAARVEKLNPGFQSNKKAKSRKKNANHKHIHTRQYTYTGRVSLSPVESRKPQRLNMAMIISDNPPRM